MKLSKVILITTVFILTVSAAAQKTAPPRTVRDFFNLLPQRYFALEGCSANPTKSNCDKARREYLQNYLEVEDTANGYWKSGCDGAQNCLEMALFKRPNGSYIVALKVEFESDSDNYFLEYKNGKWFNISSQAVPNFSQENIYFLPREGATVEVFAKVRKDDVFEKGKKLYNLVWKNGKFSVKK